MPRLPWAGALALALLPAWAQACSICGCGDPLLAAGSARPMAGQLRLSIDAEYLYATARSDDNPAATESLDQETLKAILVYSPSRSLALVLQAPFPRKDWWTNDPGEPLQATANTGLGDVELGARWFLWQGLDLQEARSQDLALSLGTSLPSGPSDLTVDGERIDQHAQLGTGAVGPYAGLLYGLNHVDWSLSASATFRGRATNAQGYQYGQSLGFGLDSQWRMIKSLALTLGLDGRYADHDHDWAAGELATETGGTVLALTPGLGWEWGEGLGLIGWVQLPVYANLFGVQGVSPTYHIGLQYLFSL